MDRIVLRPPPASDGVGAGGGLTGALPMLGGLGSIGLVATMTAGPRLYAGIGLFIALTAVLGTVQLDHRRRRRARSVGAARRDYLDHLADVRAAVRAAGGAQSADAQARWPAPDALAALAECGVWHPGEDLLVRYGVADLPLDAAPALPEIGAWADPFCAEAVRRLVGAQATRPGLPATLDLAATAAVTAPVATARALICSAVGRPAIVIAVLAGPDALVRWGWVKWLPQAGSPVAADGVGPRRLVAGSMTDLVALLPERGHLLLVVDGVPPPVLDRPGTVLHVEDPGPRPDRSADGRSGRLVVDGRTLPGIPDVCTVEAAEAFARRCVAARGAPLPTEPDWSPRPPDEHLRVSLGTSESGEEVLLDLKESALGGCGPHGMVIGATGSGKSELLRALVLRLALAHPPSELNLVLVDFKGGAAFDGLSRLPHVSALITNLADELTLLDRTGDALAGELTRRQELVRAADGDRSTLPTLLIVVDEFAELLAARPELDELFVTLGRLGRGLGIHLLLASQRLDEGRWRGLESHLSYRIGLRTFTAEESRAVLGVADAYELPPVPGLGLLRTDPRTLIRFRAPYVGTLLHRAPDQARVLPFTAAPVDGPAPTTVTLVETAVAAMQGRGRAHRIWLPPLDRPATLGGLLPALAVDPARGFGQRSATVPLGEVDRPRLQRRDRLEVDPTSGHVAVVGATGSGRSTLLRTAVAGLALTRTPDEVAIHVLDLGGSLAPLAGLPHVASLAGRDEPGLAHRIVAELARGTDRPAVLVIDDWTVLRHALPDLEEEASTLARDGHALGVHLLVAAGRWSDLRASVRDGLGTRIELRLGDPLDSEVDRRLAAAVPSDRPGRGIVDGAHFLTALPRLDGADTGPAADGGDTTAADEALADLVGRVALHWHGPAPRRLRALPRRVDLDALPPDERVRLGLCEGDHAVRLLPESGHLIVLGDGGSGRTGLLRTIMREVARTRPCDRVLVVDPRGGLIGEVAGERLLAYVRGDPTAAVGDLAAALTGRLIAGTGTGTGTGTGGRASRPVATDPDVWVVVDDLDLLPQTAWQSLLPLLARGTDVGLRLVAARRAGGVARAFYEPLLGTLRDLHSPGILLSGSPEEGPLLAGVRARQAWPGRARWVGSAGEEEAFQVARSAPLEFDRSNR